MRALLLGKAAVAAVLAAGPATAQDTGNSTQLVRGDASATLGWLNVRKSAPESYDDWANRILDAGGGAGWYWTDHLKTEIDAGATTSTERYLIRPVVVDGHPTFAPSRQTFSRRHVAVAQQYQFFRNQWFHPHVGAGVDVVWERSREEQQPLFVYDARTGQPTRLEPAVPIGLETRAFVRPFAQTGFKAYITPRAFFRSDLRVGFRNGAETALLRFGVGVDF
jgi:hypothetical protein